MTIRRNIIEAQDGFIPPKYQKCDWLATRRHAALIDTGVSGNDETLQIHVEFMPITFNENYVGVLGNYQTETDTKCWRIITNTSSGSSYYRTLIIGCGNGAASGTNGGGLSVTPLLNSSDTLINTKIIADLSYGTCTVTGTKTVTSTSTKRPDISSSTYTIALGSSRPASQSVGTSCFNIYKASFKSHGKLIRNYIPVIRRSDKLAGFYDTVNETFNPSIGTKEFIAGYDENELTLSNEYTKINRLIQNGNENSTEVSYINLRRKFNSTHRYKFIVNFSNNDNNLKNFYFFGAREQVAYTPKNSSFAYSSDYHPVFYGITNGIVNTSYSAYIDLTNTYSEDQEIELKCINGLLTCINSAGLQRATPNDAMVRETFQSETDIILGGGAVQGYTSPYYTFRAGSSIVSYEEYDEHDILITKFVPCIRNSDNIAGMYDIITNTFWPSDNPDYPFIAGYT